MYAITKEQTDRLTDGQTERQTVDRIWSEQARRKPQTIKQEFRLRDSAERVNFV